MMEWVMFAISCAFTAVGIFAFVCGVVGVGRFGFCLNRLHAAAVADTIGISCIAMSAIVYIGIDFVSLKELVVLVIMLLTSPVCSHLLADLEYSVSGKVYENCRIENRCAEDENGTDRNN